MNQKPRRDSLPGFRRGAETLHTLKRNAQKYATTSERIADFFTAFSGNMKFVYLHSVWFIVWVAWNIGMIPGLAPFDPFPFGLLTMIVSLEAIFLSTFVLISQNREQKINEIRDEIDTQINLYQEQEITQVLRIVHRIEKHLGLKDEDEKSVKMMEMFVNPDNLFRQIEEMVLRQGELGSVPNSAKRNRDGEPVP
jgi:uncharacterized membrane protein